MFRIYLFILQNSNSIKVQLRIRRDEHVMLEVPPVVTFSDWSERISEVLSPVTGLFVPVSTAIRAGWLDLQPESCCYVNNETGVSLPIKDAIENGFINLVDPQPLDGISESRLYYIRRTTFGLSRARITGYVDHEEGVEYTIDEAYRRGWISFQDGQPVIYDTQKGIWVSKEEAIDYRVIQTEPDDEDTDEEVYVVESQHESVSEIVAIKPAGEPTEWLSTVDAARLGLFNWQNGRVATDWPARPQLPASDSELQHYVEDFIPTGWCPLLTAIRTNWVYLHTEAQPIESLLSADQLNENCNYVILATDVSIAVPGEIPIGEDYEQQASRFISQEQGRSQSESLLSSCVIEDFEHTGSRNVDREIFGRRRYVHRRGYHPEQTIRRYTKSHENITTEYQYEE